MRRRRFDHLHVELSLAVDRRILRFALWTALQERGADPESLSREEVLDFCDGPLDAFLADCGLHLDERRARRLRRRLARFDPAYPAPEEVFARL